MAKREILRKFILSVLDRLGLRLWAIRNRHILDKLYYGFFAFFEQLKPKRSSPLGDMSIAGQKNLPLVSVIFLSYQHEKYIEPALDSALAQDYPNLEILISDDCSTDSSLEIIERKLASYQGPHSVYLNVNSVNQNAHHLDYAIPKTHGDVIVIACSDDIMYPDRVCRLVSQLQTSGVSLIGSNATAKSTNGKTLGLFYPKGKMPTLNMRDLLVNFHVFPSFGASIAFRREVYEHFGKLKPGPREVDMILPFRALLLNGLDYIPDPLFDYLVHDTNDNFSRYDSQANSHDELKKIGMQKIENQRKNLVVMQETLSEYVDAGHRPKPMAADQIFELISSVLQKLDNKT